MYCMSAVTVIGCLVSISIVMQGADAQNCLKIVTCMTNYGIAMQAILGAGGNTNALCSAAKTYLDCLNEVSTDCNLDSGYTLSQMIATAKQTLSQLGCGGGADAENCSPSKIATCLTNYNSAIAGAGEDTNTFCSAANTYLDCLNEVHINCNFDSGITSLGQTINAAKQTLSQYGCGDGADTQNCSPSKITRCLVNYVSAIAAGAGKDKNTLCSAGNTYMDCLNEVVTDCNLDSGSTLSQTIAAAKQAISKYLCGGGADAQNCSSSKITTCSTNYNSAIAGAGEDTNTFCSAANTYLDCLNEVVTNCILDSGSISLNQTIAAAKQTLSQYGCGGGADAENCSPSKIATCLTNYNSAIAGAGEDTNTFCSAANTYLDCLNEVVTNCNLDSGSISLNQTIAAAKQTRSQYGCGGANGAGSLVFNLVAIVSGHTFYKLF